jgi:hypothetical protein
MKQHIVELPPINHFSTPAALVEVPFLRFAQLVKVSGIHFLRKRVQESSITSRRIICRPAVNSHSSAILCGEQGGMTASLMAVV